MLGLKVFHRASTVNGIQSFNVKTLSCMTSTPKDRGTDFFGFSKQCLQSISDVASAARELCMSSVVQMMENTRNKHIDVLLPLFVTSSILIEQEPLMQQQSVDRPHKWLAPEPATYIQ